eukprot:423521-Pleurochrysis_carterae.AAC.2
MHAHTLHARTVDRLHTDCMRISKSMHGQARLHDRILQAYAYHEFEYTRYKLFAVFSLPRSSCMRVSRKRA